MRQLSSSIDRSSSQLLADSEEGADRPQSHKRTFSTGPDQKSVDDPSADDVPPNKKTKRESQSESANIPDTQVTPDDGDDLIPLMSQGPNVFYGYTDALWEFLEFAENEGPYWLKSMVVDRYKTHGGQDNAEPLTCVGITSDSKNLQTPEAKLLQTHFNGLSNDWYEVTLKRQKPEGMGMRVMVESSLFDQFGEIRGGKDLGEWWITDIQPTEGESQKAIETVVAMMF